VLRGCALGTILGAGFLIHTWGMRSTSVVVSAFVTGTAVVFAPLGAWLWLGRTPTRRTAAAMTLATVGLAVITVPGAGFGSGGALIAVAAVLWAVHLVALEAWSRPGEVYALAVIQVGTVALLAALVQTVAGAGLTLPDRPSTWLALVGLGAIATGGAFVALTWAQTRMDATTAAVVLTLEPVFGAAAALALGETLTLPSTIGAAAVITATFLVVKRTGPTISAEAGE
jgi:drug/metabolite transporter (DMT)-like permease